LGVARKEKKLLTCTPGVLIFWQMKEREENLGTAGKHGKVGANLAMLLASQDLKPTVRMGEAQSTWVSQNPFWNARHGKGRCDCDKAVQPKVVSVDV